MVHRWTENKGRGANKSQKDKNKLFSTGVDPFKKEVFPSHLFLNLTPPFRSTAGPKMRSEEQIRAKR